MGTRHRELDLTSPTGRGRIALAIRVSDYLRSQVALAYAARASRAFALSLTSSLRASAMRITIFSFPLARNLSRDAPRLWSKRAAVAATRNRIERTPERPPRTGRLPLRLPLSLAIGATPTSLAMAVLE